MPITATTRKVLAFEHIVDALSLRCFTLNKGRIDKFVAYIIIYTIIVGYGVNRLHVCVLQRESCFLFCDSTKCEQTLKEKFDQAFFKNKRKIAKTLVWCLALKICN